MIIHHLKIEEKYLNAILEGRKTFEVRKNDRNYNEGDYIEFYGNPTRFKITYILYQYGLLNGYVVLAIKKEE